ncbi:MAG: sigma-70 family RNA polymerase sigma factor [Romboutsia sp.]|uniref:sigma-70 family RNA polymerase sigma factor n=1 Tax=Romboutsia sp. TaxID=1965302 RepID=UPI003F38227C
MENIMKLYKQKTINIDVHLAKTGDKEAYVRLVRENKEAMYRIAKSIVSIDADVEDAVSETILNAYMNINKLRKNEYFKTWIIRILINECNLILKKRKREVGLDELTLNSFIKEDYKKDIDLYNAINNLDYDLKITTLLFYFEDMKYYDIAKVLNIREGTVKSRLSRAKEKLYKLLEEVK